MTAIVGILNKHAVAIAADSAVTVSTGDNTKIYNTSQKIFKISDKNPVALMIYDNAAFMGAPWEVIVDLYRQERGNNTFKKVQDYANDFLKFLSDCEYLNGPEEQRKYLLREMYAIYSRLNDAIDARVDDDIENRDDLSRQDVEECYSKRSVEVMKEFSDLCQEAGPNDEINLTPEQFQKIAQDGINYILDEISDDEWSEKAKQYWAEAFYKALTSKFAYSKSGLVFVGYGSKNIYPSLYAVNVCGIFNDVLRWEEYEKEDITNDNTSSIIPFAQTDVMMTMLKGIAPAFQAELIDSHLGSLNNVVDQIRSRMEENGISQKVIDKVLDIDVNAQQEKYVEHCDSFMKDNYTTGVVDAVECFNTEDMANMAESLISITNLQRHISSSEESVGGPVEVALITRGGGFRWIKHREF